MGYLFHLTVPFALHLSVCSQYKYDPNASVETFNLRDPTVQEFYKKFRGASSDQLSPQPGIGQGGDPIPAQHSERQHIVNAQVNRAAELVFEGSETPQPPGCARKHADALSGPRVSDVSAAGSGKGGKGDDGVRRRTGKNPLGIAGQL